MEATFKEEFCKEEDDSSEVVTEPTLMMCKIFWIMKMIMTEFSSLNLFLSIQ